MTIREAIHEYMREVDHVDVCAGADIVLTDGTHLRILSEFDANVGRTDKISSIKLLEADCGC